jgi:hypothetical protein
MALNRIQHIKPVIRALNALHKETYVEASVLLVAGFMYLHDRRSYPLNTQIMFFKKAPVPNLTTSLSNLLNKSFDVFEKSAFKTQVLNSGEKVELATYLLFFHIHAMLMRDVPRDIVLAFPTNVAVFPVLTSDEKIELAKKYRERMEEYVKTLTDVEDKIVY